jgi:hypothetical protein
MKIITLQNFKTPQINQTKIEFQICKTYLPPPVVLLHKILCRPKIKKSIPF